LFLLSQQRSFGLLQMSSLRLAWAGDNMNTLRLTDDEIRQVFATSRRFLINESTNPHDLQLVLMERLRGSQPDLAAKIGRMDPGQMASLCRTMLVRQQMYS
jgi:hypothetical protein